MALSGIYFHIPFCSKACAYCDFHFSTSMKLKTPVLSAMEAELAQRLETCEWTNLQSIYFGGGTPSLLHANEIERFLDQLAGKFSLEGIEITLEANPDNLSRETLAALKAVGINRLSIGIQSFFDEDLLWMNRSHHAQQAEQCLEDAATLGFKELNADLIFGYPLLSDEKWLMNMEKMLRYPVTHLSTYSMTVESGTALHHAIHHKKEKPMHEGQAEKQYRMIMDFLEKKGWDHYEISNFCLPGHPSIHNSAYWKGSEYLGIGPSAHGFSGTERYWNVANNVGYIKSMEQGILPSEKEVLSDKNIHNEYLLTRLRTKQGILLEEFEKRFGQPLTGELVDAIKSDNLSPYFFMDEVSLRLNNEGYLLADHLISELFWD